MPGNDNSGALTDREKPGPVWRLWLSTVSTLLFCGGVAFYLHSSLAAVPDLQAQEQDFLASRFLDAVPPDAQGPPIALGNDAVLVGISYTPQTIAPRDSLRIKSYFQTPKTPTTEIQIKVHLMQGKNSVVSDSHLVLRGLKSALDWPQDKFTLDDHFVRIPNAIEPGTYRLTLILTTPDGKALSPTLTLGPISVR
jgi:hypothetical protein